jgi:hypothetical protein
MKNGNKKNGNGKTSKDVMNEVMESLSKIDSMKVEKAVKVAGIQRTIKMRIETETEITTEDEKEIISQLEDVISIYNRNSDNPLKIYETWFAWK